MAVKPPQRLVVELLDVSLGPTISKEKSCRREAKNRKEGIAMIDIELTNELRLRSDNDCYMLAKKRTKKGVVLWEGFKFYSDIRSVMSHLPEYLIRQEDISSVAELVDRLDAWQEYLKLKFKPNGGWSSEKTNA